MNVREEVLRVLDEVLSLEGRALTFTSQTLLLGAIPELDSMAVVTLLTSLEEKRWALVPDVGSVRPTSEFIAGDSAGAVFRENRLAAWGVDGCACGRSEAGARPG